jgi:predicted Rossmann fold flavoprotein
MDKSRDKSRNFSNNGNIVVIGGGAAGFFGAIACAKTSSKKVIILEKMRQVLSKVRISGGGRCNVTHVCFEPALLAKNYPRGEKALIGPFTRFQPKETIRWFESHGVKLKEESDGRIFPVTDQSETIIHCLMDQAKKSGVELRTECGIEQIERLTNGYLVHTSKNEMIECERLLIASGSNPKMYDLIRTLGHTIVPPVPSLFTLTIPLFPLKELAGISVPNARVEILGLPATLSQTGALLITHWGFSGPAALKLSAWGARSLHEIDYKGTIKINWAPEFNEAELQNVIVKYKTNHPSRQIGSSSPIELPRNLWKELILLSGIDTEQRWSSLSKIKILDLMKSIQSNNFPFNGKSMNKEEFVTCGGVKLDEVNFKTMESRILPGLYFAGEVLDIDGITGGFNFQNAWTTAWIAGNSMGSYSPSSYSPL